MNVRQKLSLAALCLTLPVMASAQAAAAPAAAPAFEFKPYGFLALTYNQTQGAFSNPEYPSVVTSEDDSDNILTVRQSRIGWNMANADGGYTGAKLGARLEFDFMGPGIAAYNSAPVRLRYAYANAGWDFGPMGKVTLLVGQTDGLVNVVHPELGAYLANPMFLQAGNLTRRSPQIRASYTFSVPMVALTAEVAALSAADAASATLSAGNNSGQPDLEGRLQVVVTPPVKDVKATIGVGYHTNKRLYDTVAGKAADAATFTPAVQAVEETELTNTLIGVDANVDATRFLNVRGEWYQSEGADDVYGAAFPGAVFLKDADFATADPYALTKSTGYWFQATIKPLPILWVIAGMGHSEVDEDTLTAQTATSKDLLETNMLNVGVLSNVSKNWRLGLEYTASTTTRRNNTAALEDIELEASQIAFSSRFTF